MPNLLSMPIDFLKEKTAYWTAQEISQQPDSWLKALDRVNGESSAIGSWLNPILAKENLRIILTGAGTSAYIGEALSPYLTQEKGRLFEAISTTDIVSNPKQYLVESSPTLLVSYGRSGDSPESVAATQISDSFVTECYHLTITCNEKGSLAKFANDSPNAFNLLMPEETLDQSFAMTSSYTSMLVATLCIFAPNEDQLRQASRITRVVIENALNISRKAKTQSNRFIFLGSGSMSGFAKEASLKLQELSSGLLNCYSESTLGFRHGPKSIVDPQTEILIFDAQYENVANYDSDLINELYSDGIASSISRLSQEVLFEKQTLDGPWLGLPYIVYCQIFALFKSIELGITPDNPCPTGEVNRVVKGVKIYSEANLR